MNDHMPSDSLLAIGAITPRQLHNCTQASIETGLPIGWILLSQGFITEQLLSSAICGQRLVQQQALADDQALSYLRTARLKSKDFRTILQEQQIDTQIIDLELLWEDLLVKSSTALKSELLACRELAILKKIELADLLLDTGILSEPAFMVAQAVVEKVKNNALSIDQGIALLKKLKLVNWQLNKLGDPIPSQKQVQTNELLALTDLLTIEQLNSAIELSNQEQKPLAKILVESGTVEQLILDIVEKCKSFINNNLLSQTKAGILISYCAENQCSLEHALSQFGWVVLPTAAI